MKTSAILITVLCLSGCDLPGRITMENRIDADEKDYRACLSDNLTNPSRCDALKAVLDSDKAQYASGNW